MNSAATRRRKRRVADENRKRAPRAERSVPLDGQFLSAADESIQHGVSASPNEILRSGDSMNPHDLLSPSSVLSQRLADQVIACQSKRAPWPNILSRLREAFSLDGHAIPEEKDMIAMHAHITGPKPLHPSELARLRTAIDAFPPRPIADFLLVVVLKHATDTFFYFDQDQMLGEIAQFYQDSNSPLRSDITFVCLAMAAFALGSQWAPLERPDESVISLHRDPDNMGRFFYNHAKALIPDTIDRPCLRSIQAPFLLGVYLMPASAIGSSYIYMGLALRKALAFDLHIDADGQTITTREREVRRRLWWSIYSLERCTTVKLNKPRSVNVEIIKAPHPSPLPALDRLQKYDNIQFQMAYTRLMKILDQIAEPRSLPDEAAEQSRAERWESDLREWKKSLPSDFKMDAMHPKDSRFRTIFHLYLNYHYAWITMGKVALVTVARTGLRSHLQPWSKPPEQSDFIIKQSRSCAKAARKLLVLFEHLASTGNTTRFSFTDFQGCSIATIVTLVAGIMERDSGYEARVTFGLDCLRKMATGNITAKMGVKFVEAVQSITNEAAARIHQESLISTNATQDVQASDTTSAYNRWATWLTEMECSQTEEHTLHPERGSEGNRDVPYSETFSSQIEQSNDLDIPGWRAENDSVPEHLLDSQDIPQGSTIAWGLQSTDDDFLAALQNDDPAFLMGLTGLDLLNFSGLT
ncbi:uncharacterized protein N7511_006499 [Penicillium nucicola]|uniref:uncharacterized protein n=1 Tax=Penicillium nucicola TaxID=1850975 RepID=UPI00254558CA|nr:uncharacterized protein N7511_006499 [Penicillium nucicola]KAJ5757805.1 hypothetical protein N7511_006499 [Penicillium nucicola]